MQALATSNKQSSTGIPACAAKRSEAEVVATTAPRPQTGMSVLLVLLAVVFFAPTVFAQDRTPAEAERMYETVGDQLFCICGCREKLLACSHNVCSAKDQERAFLHELSQNPKLDEAGMKAEMVKRFGKGVLQVPEDSSLYPLLFTIGGVLIVAFGAGFWVVTRHEKSPDEPEAKGRDPELEARIANELKELD